MTCWAYDPTTTWLTIETPHFRVHFAQGDYEIAVKVACAAETAFDKLTPLLGWRPSSPIQLVLDDESDSANGYATGVPYNLINVRTVAPPDLSAVSAYLDWIDLLVTHELTHIIHFDTMSGFPRLFNAVFGRWFLPNAVQPRWLMEGLATYLETKLTGRGRLGSSYADMVVRMDVLERGAFRLDEISGDIFRWPRANIPYLYGAYFVAYVAERFGEDVWRQISHDYAQRAVPFSVNLSVARATGLTYEQLYVDFVAHLSDKFNRQRHEIEQRGRREGWRITKGREEIGPVRIGSDGIVYFVDNMGSRDPSLRSLGPGGVERVITQVRYGAQLGLIPGAKRAILAQPEIYATYRVYNDLFQVDLETGALERLTAGARAHDPDVSPDGRHLVFVQNDNLHSVLRLAPVHELDKVQTLVDLGPQTQVWSPRFSPDGSRVAFVGFRHRRRDLFCVELAQGELRQLTADQAIEGAPAFSPDGKSVLFHGDPNGIYNLFAVPVVGEDHPRQLTRVLGGAFRPEVAPDGRSLIYVAYGAEGFDLARLPLGEPGQARDREAAKDPASTPLAAAGSSITSRRAQAYPVRAYSALPTLLPRAWLPTLSYDTQGLSTGVELTGQDALESHVYGLSAWWGLSSRFLGFGASYANRQFDPGLKVALSRFLGYAASPYVRNGRAERVEEEVWLGSLATTWPLVAKLTYEVNLNTSYRMALRRPTRPLLFDPLDRGPRFPDEGRFAAVVLGLSLRNTRWYAGSISPVDGGRFSLDLRLEDPYLGSEYSAVSARVAGAYFVANPWLHRHVLALSGVGGYGISNYRRRGLFVLGGLVPQDPLWAILNNRVGVGSGLRGFPPGAFAGDALLEAHLEYRLPLWDIERGLSTMPIFLRTLHAALFLDAGAVAETPKRLRHSDHYSVGAEVRLGILFAYQVPVTLRLGYGQGLGRDSWVRNVYVVTGNVF